MNPANEYLGADESCVLRFLNNWPDSFVSGMEIARRADGKTRFSENPGWADTALSRLVELNLVESDSRDKFRVKSRPAVTCGGRKRFVAPHLRAILEKHGRKFDLAA